MPFWVIEAFSIVVALTCVLTASVAWRERKHRFLLGCLSSASILITVWFWAKLSFVAPGLVPAQATMVRFVYPALEEGVRVFCIYSILNRQTLWRDLTVFTIGYAAFEPLYKIIEFTSSELSFGGFGSDSVAYLIAMLIAPFSILFSLSVLIGFLSKIGASAPLAFLISFALHSSYNTYVDLVDRSALFAQFWPCWVAALLVAILALGWMRIMERNKEAS